MHYTKRNHRLQLLQLKIKGIFMDKMAKLGEKDQNVAFLGVVFHENLLVSLSLDQKEQNCFGHPHFYSSIAPMVTIHRQH